MRQVSPDASFDSSDPNDAYRYAATTHMVDLSRQLLRIRSSSELSERFPILYRATKVLLAHTLYHDEEYRASAKDIEEGEQADRILQTARETVTTTSTPYSADELAERERAWAKLEEMQMSIVRQGLWGAQQRKVDVSGADLFEDTSDA